MLRKSSPLREHITGVENNAFQDAGALFLPRLEILQCAVYTFLHACVMGDAILNVTDGLQCLFASKFICWNASEETRGGKGRRRSRWRRRFFVAAPAGKRSRAGKVIAGQSCYFFLISLKGDFTVEPADDALIIGVLFQKFLINFGLALLEFI